MLSAVARALRKGDGGYARPRRVNFLRTRVGGAACRVLAHYPGKVEKDQLSIVDQQGRIDKATSIRSALQIGTTFLQDFVTGVQPGPVLFARMKKIETVFVGDDIGNASLESHEGFDMRPAYSVVGTGQIADVIMRPLAGLLAAMKCHEVGEARNRHRACALRIVYATGVKLCPFVGYGPVEGCPSVGLLDVFRTGGETTQDENGQGGSFIVHEGHHIRELFEGVGFSRQTERAVDAAVLDRDQLYR